MNKQESTKKKKIFGKIQDCYKKGTLVPFIGAGFSSNIQGGPTWKDFIKKLSKDLGKKEDFLLEEFKKGQNAYLRASEYYICKKGKEAFQEKLRYTFRNIRYGQDDQWNIHNILVNLDKIPLIYTTN